MMSRGYQEFEGIDPRSGEIGIYRIAMARIDNIGRYHPGEKLYDLHAVAKVCAKPAFGFEGLRDIDDAFCHRERFVDLPDPDGICVVGIPGVRSTSQGKVPPPKGFTFGVVATKKLEIWNWFWWESDRAEKALPIYYEQRFDRLIWPRKQTFKK